MSLENQLSVQPNTNAPATGTTTPPADPPEPEGAVTVGTQRMAPVSAVIEERRGRQAVQAERDRLAQENADLRKVKENWDTVSPYVHLLATHPAVTGKQQQQHAPQADPELVNIAKTFGFYDDAGQPDIDRAQKAQAYMDTRAKSQVETAVKPVAQTAATVQAQALRQHAYNVTDKQGRPFATKENIDAVLGTLSPEQAANPEVVNVALMVARGMGVPAGEPLHTENAGGRGGTAPALSNLERAAAKALGRSDDQWIKARDDNSMVLE